MRIALYKCVLAHNMMGRYKHDCVRIAMYKYVLACLNYTNICVRQVSKCTPGMVHCLERKDVFSGAKVTHSTSAIVISMAFEIPEVGVVHIWYAYVGRMTDKTEHGGGGVLC